MKDEADVSPKEQTNMEDTEAKHRADVDIVGKRERGRGREERRC